MYVYARSALVSGTCLYGERIAPGIFAIFVIDLMVACY